jgi:pimeloyl-ACP methyl ester carboxylesterase
MSSDKGFLGPQSVWAGIGVVAAMMFGWQAMQPKPDPDAPPVAVRNVRAGVDMRLQELTRSDCLVTLGQAQGHTTNAVECISFVASANAQGAETALVFLDGDALEKDLVEASQDSARTGYQRLADKFAERYQVPVVVVGRPGMMGSTGFQLLGGQRDEGYVVDGALDGIKAKLGVRRLALAGQSGGSRIIAQLMVIGRADIACAAMGSGAYDVPGLRNGGRSMTNIWGDPGRRYLVPLQRAGEIQNSPARRSFVIGDPRDTVADFNEQKAWADKLATLGHHVVAIEAEASPPSFHGMSQRAILAAAMCATGKSDDQIKTAVVAKPEP